MIERHFLGFQTTGLTSASRWLIDSVAAGGPIDLGDTVVVVPTGRSGRQLRARLLNDAQAATRGLIPPRIVTVSHLPELLYEPKRPFASTWVQHLAWTTALTRSGQSIRKQIAPALVALEAENDAGDTTGMDEGWLDVGRMLWKQYRELTAEGLSFADVAERGTTLDGFFEHARWQALATVQNEYLRALDNEHIWDKQTARLVAVRNKECHFAGRIVLLGTVDLNPTMCQMLDQVSNQVTALVYAPEAWESRFDRHGCVAPEAWESAPIELGEVQWSVAYGPQEQGERITELLQRLQGEYAAEEVVIGCADAALVPFVQRSLSERDVESRWSGGMPMEQTGPVQLLIALGGLLDGMRFTRFCEWIRHPDVLRWLASKKVFPVAQVDRYFNFFLPATWTEPVRGERERWQVAHLAIEHTRTLLSALRDPKLPVTAWMPRVRKVVESIYSAEFVTLDDAHAEAKHAACEAIDDAIAGMSAMPSTFAVEVTATQAIRLIISAVTGERVAQPWAGSAVELLGWLDLPLDEAPVAIVTGFNEGVVPQSVTSDLFLPDRLRQHLQINDNRTRYARDAYAFSVLVGSRQFLHVIALQNDIHADPLLPSRLLFCCDDQTRASRWLRFSDAVNGSRHQVPNDANETRANSLFATPLPDDAAELPKSLSVTAFKSYLQCPYLFYLQRILRLDFVDDEARELAGNRFGTLIHTALERFGRSAAKASVDSQEIYRAVASEFRACVSEVCGDAPLAAVSVQVEQALLRLQAFARVQSQLRQEGWEIAYVESDEQTCVEWLVDDVPFQIHGMVDRIDVHQDTGQVRVIDYKTGDRGVTVDDLWDAASGWTDLQLPLYRHLANKLGFAGPYEAAYFAMPKRCEDTAVKVVPWTEDSLAQADEQARHVIRCIRRREFWPPAEERPPFSEPWKDIAGV